MSHWVKAARLEDLPERKLHALELEGEALVLVRIGDHVYAFRDVCSHMEYPLSDGSLDDHIVTCAYHGAKFDIRDGSVVAMPAFEPIETFPVRIQDGVVYVDLAPET